MISRWIRVCIDASQRHSFGEVGLRRAAFAEGEYHHGQWMVNHYNNAVTKAFDYQIAVNTHEPIKGLDWSALGRTGWLVRVPADRNSMHGVSRKELRGSHSYDGIYKFLSGPMDYTPGVFQLETKSGPDGDNRVRSTVGQQFGLYVVVPSPIQMAWTFRELREAFGLVAIHQRRGCRLGSQYSGGR